MTIGKKIIDAADKGLRGMVYQENATGSWHPSHQDWANIEKYVKPILALIAAARKEIE